MPVTTRMVPPLVRHLARAISWIPLLLVAPLVPLLAAALVWLAGQELGVGAATNLLRAGGLLLGAGAAFALADDLAGSTAAVPSPRWLRHWLRTALALGYAVVAWTGAHAVVALLATDPLPQLLDTALPAGGCVLFGLACAALAVRRAPDRYGASTGAAVLAVLFAVSLLVPAHWSPWPTLGAPQWGPAHTGWLVASLVSLAALALAHRDSR